MQIILVAGVCYTGLDLFVAFDHQALSVQSRGPHYLPDAPQSPLAHQPPHGANEICPGFYRAMSLSSSRDKMPDVWQQLSWTMSISRGPPTRYKTTNDGWYTSTAFSEPPDHSHPVTCAPGPWMAGSMRVLVEKPGHTPFRLGSTSRM